MEVKLPRILSQETEFCQDIEHLQSAWIHVADKEGEDRILSNIKIDKAPLNPHIIAEASQHVSSELRD